MLAGVIVGNKKNEKSRSNGNDDYVNSGICRVAASQTQDVVRKRSSSVGPGEKKRLGRREGNGRPLDEQDLYGKRTA